MTDKTIRWVSKVSLGISLQLFMTACDLPPEAKPWMDRAGKEGRIFLLTLAEQLGYVPPEKPVTQPQPSASPTELITSGAAKRAKENSELLREMMWVTLMKDPKDPAEFGNWVDTLNQGASLEGVYNGLTHSSNYRTLEETHKGALPAALKAFGQELALLEADLPVVTQFDADAALPLPVMNAQGDENNPTETLEFSGGRVPAKTLESNPAPVKVKPDINALGAQYAKQFVGSSIFTLKRVLGDEALKLVASLLQSGQPGGQSAGQSAAQGLGQRPTGREKLAFWYSKWVEHMSQWKVDFGVPQRNQVDEAFHYQWAMENSDDRVRWEVLNRLHRVLNETNRMKQ